MNTVFLLSTHVKLQLYAYSVMTDDRRKLLPINLHWGISIKVRKYFLKLNYPEEYFVFNDI